MKFSIFLKINVDKIMFTLSKNLKMQQSSLRAVNENKKKVERKSIIFFMTKFEKKTEILENLQIILS